MLALGDRARTRPFFSPGATTEIAKPNSYRTGPDEFVGYIAMRSGDEVREERLDYRRRGSD